MKNTPQRNSRTAQPRGQAVPEEGDLLTVKEAAAYLRLNFQTVYRLASRRRLPSCRIYRCIRFRRSDLEAFIDQNARPAIS